jgi:V8-like Glu-specific endopeptidase
MAIAEVPANQRLTGYYAQCGVVFVTWPDGTRTQGTCAVVGQNDILTAGHVVYNPDRGGWASEFDFYFGADYNNVTANFDSYAYSYSLTSDFKWYVRAWPDELYADSDNTTLRDSEAQYDIALIGVSKAIGDILGWFGIDWGRNYTQSVIQVGYPANSTGMMSSTITVTKNSFYDVYESSQDVMGPGSSGGPLFTSDGYVIGVKSSGNSTSATWADIGFLSTYLIQYLASNDYLLGAIADDYLAATSTTGKVVVGNSTTGVIETVGDRDWFAVTLSAGIKYKFSLESQSGGLGDPMLKLYGLSGLLLLSDDDSGSLLDAEINYTPVSSGTYYLEAQASTSPYSVSAVTGGYKLSASTISSTYSITTSSSSVNEGSTAQFSLVTTNVAAGTLISYSISGVSALDLQSGVLTGSVTVSSTGTTTISIPIAADGITEGSETLTLTAQGKSASVVINDTSTAANTVQVYDTDLSGKSLTNGAKRYSGTSGNDTISGTAGGDLIYGNDGDDKLYGNAGNDQVSGLNGNDYLSGGDGDDRLFGSKGDDQIYGGKGSDTATYDADYSNYTVSVLYDSKNAVSGYKVVDKTGKEGTDTISTDVEFLEFNYGRTVVTLSNGTITAKTTNNAPTGVVSISGTVRQNETLTVSNSISDADGVGAITYKWRVSIDNKTWTDLSSGSTLKLTESEVGKYLFAYASYVDGKGNSESISSTATISVVNVNDSPVGSVLISGTAKSGQVLTASNNLTDADGLGVISYAWQSSSDGLTWTNLSNGSTLTVSNTLVGKYIRANATYIDGRGTSESVPSIKTEAVKSLTQLTSTESHSLSVIVDKGILGADAVLLKGLSEYITMIDGVITAHSLMYAGSTFDYNQIDALIMTVTRNDEFTAEFTKEINDYLKTEANIAYKVAVGLVGAANIDTTLMTVAGADGTYVS